ncbi:MAG TPA: hypothetical protein VIL86_20570, partial [Tepidisphaeraceae bacterium]|jgi:hypothetical protein
MSLWTLTLRPEGDGPPEACRVRRLLKLALRSCGLRCIDVRHEDTPRPTHADERNEAPMKPKASEPTAGRCDAENET